MFKCMHACWRCAEANQLRATLFWQSPIVISDFQNRHFHKSMRHNVNKTHHTKTFAHRKQATFAHRKMLGPTTCFWVQLHTLDAFRVLGQIAAWTHLDLYVLSKNTQWESNPRISGGRLDDDARFKAYHAPRDEHQKFEWSSYFRQRTFPYNIEASLARTQWKPNEPHGAPQALIKNVYRHLKKIKLKKINLER